MRHKIRLTTLTQVHVGSGQMLLNGSDFIEKNGKLFLLDVNKVGQLIGIDRNKAEIWAQAIDDGTGQQFLERELHGVDLGQCSTRVIDNMAGPFVNGQQLREGIHDGRGLPYLPGSSIKGAIRTAILAPSFSKMQLEEQFLNEFSTIKKEEKNDLNRRLEDADTDEKKQDARRECRHLFARRYVRVLRTLERFMNSVTGEVQKDPFRLLQIGDAFFSSGSEVALKQVNLNERTSTKELLDTSKQLAVEAIRSGAESEFSIKIVEKEHIRQTLNNPEVVPDTVQRLFRIINNHTKALIEYEIDYWSALNEDGFNGAIGYIGACRDMLQVAEGCGENECVMRMGNAIGWNFMTGAWLLEETFDPIFKDVIVNSARPRNEIYYNFEFPKSRRIDARNEHPLFGFVKLEVLPN